MILKSFEINKAKISKSKLFLFYGANQGFKEQLISEIFKKDADQVFNYSETQVLTNEENFYTEVLSDSFFENRKLIIISGCSDKILNTIQDISKKEFTETKIILVSDILDKKSKLRTFFEKEKSTICVPFYDDNNQTLVKIAQNFCYQRKINISQQSLNALIERCGGDRINLKNELTKIENFLGNRKKIEHEELIKLTNLIENYSISELIDNSLAKNKKKTLNILNENNFSSEDCIIISRVYLKKLKRLLNLHSKIKNETDIENAVQSYKPPIFWKEKEIIKQQIKNSSHEKITDLIIKTNKIELLVKKNPSTSLNIVTNFILEQVT